MADSDLQREYKERYDKGTETGKLNLEKSLKDQKILQNLEKGTKDAIDKIIKCIEIFTCSSEDDIYKEEGLAKNYLFFILKGKCRGYKENNVVAVLNAGECFGEFPILDHTQEYNVTARSYGESCFGKITEKDLTNIANNHPKIWYNMARMLAERLRNMNHVYFSKHKNEIPKLFIGSSSESLNVATALKELLKSKSLAPEIWNEKTFDKLGTSYLNRLEVAVNEFDFGVFIFHDDDNLESRGEKGKTTRDNVIFELGMFVGQLSRNKAFVLLPEDRNVKILSDFSGIIVAKYKSKTMDIKSALKPAVKQILDSIKEENAAQQRRV